MSLKVSRSLETPPKYKSNFYSTAQMIECRCVHNHITPSLQYLLMLVIIVCYFLVRYSFIKYLPPLTKELSNRSPGKYNYTHLYVEKVWAYENYVHTWLYYHTTELLNRLIITFFLLLCSPAKEDPKNSRLLSSFGLGMLFLTFLIDLIKFRLNSTAIVF